MSEAKFSIGQVVRHNKFDYRGVVYDVDPVFSLSEEWYEQVARSRPPKDQPWFHVLVDGSDQTTYVAQRHLDADERPAPIRHPLVDELFGAFADGAYPPRRGVN